MTSKKYEPTQAQAQNPILTSMAAIGATEEETIEVLFQAYERLKASYISERTRAFTPVVIIPRDG